MKAIHEYSVHSWPKCVVVIVVVLGIGFSPRATADGTIEQALKNLANALLEDPNLAPDTKKALAKVIEALESERRTADGTPEPTSTSLEPHATRVSKLDRFSFSGDLRLRHESSVNMDTSRDRHRERLRLRVGGEAKLTPELTMGARLVTGNPSDPKSTHQTLGNGYDSFDVSLDRVYLNYRPEWLKNGWAFAGKFSDPFARNPVFDGLAWDSDVQPEGVAVGYTFDSVRGLDNIKLVLGEYVLQERGQEDDAFVTAAQLSARKIFGDRFVADLAVGYYSYSDAELSDQIAENGGNASSDTDNDGSPDAFDSDFGVLNPIASLSYVGWKKKITFSGEYLHNLRAHNSEDTGWAIGAAIGKTESRGDWEVYYQWQKVEQDAVYSLVSQDDFLSTTNFIGHVAGSKIQLTDSIQLHLWALVSERDEPDRSADQTRESQWRLRGDLNIKF